MPNSQLNHTNRPRLHFVGLLQTNKAMLMLCISIAFFVWLSTKMAKTYETTVPITVEYKLPRAKTFKNEPPTLINAEVRAEGWQLLTMYLSGGAQKIQIAVGNNTKVIDNLKIRKAIGLILPRELTVINFAPENIILELDNRSEKKVKLAVTYLVDSKEYRVINKTPNLGSDSVIITGPKSEISTINLWGTDTIRLTTLLKKPNGRIGLKRHSNPKIQFSPNSVFYKTQVEQVTEKKLDIPIKVRHAKDSLQLFPSWATVLCQVGLSDYDKLQPDLIEAFVDLENVDLTKVSKLKIQFNSKTQDINIQSHYPEKTDFVIVKKKK